jgi:hypothetical protein
LATFLAAFFFFFAMDMAPCREHPDTNLTPISADAPCGNGRRFIGRAP